MRRTNSNNNNITAPNNKIEQNEKVKQFFQKLNVSNIDDCFLKIMAAGRVPSKKNSNNNSNNNTNLTSSKPG